MSYYVYILICADDTLYTGITNNLKRRVYEHNTTKRAAAYTKIRRPVRVVYSEVCTNRSEAQKRELEIKKLTRKEKLALIQNTNDKEEENNSI